MKPKANLVLVLSLVALALSAHGQGASNPPVPSVPRADGSGPSVPSMSPAIGDIPTPPPAAPKAGNGSKAGTDSAALDAAARAAEKPVLTVPAPLANGKGGPTVPSNKAWAVEGSPTVSMTGPASPVSEVLDTTTLTQQIRELSLGNRAEFLNALETRVEGTDRDLNQVRQNSRQLKGDARATFRAADDDVRSRHKALKRSLKEARTATAETWPKIRAALAADYEAYSVALVRVEASSAVGR